MGDLTYVSEIVHVAVYVVIVALFAYGVMYVDKASNEDIAKLIDKAGNNEKAKEIVNSYIYKKRLSKQDCRSASRRIFRVIIRDQANLVVAEFKKNNRPPTKK